MKGLAHYQLSHGLKTLFAFGGSQGSFAINQSIVRFVEKKYDYQILWQTGSSHYDEFKHYDSSTVRVVPFIEDMSQAYSLSDLVYSRAGALTLAELTACGLPSILVPLPSSAADHQTKNALSLESKNAAVIVKESVLNEINLNRQIKELIHDEIRLKAMSDCSKALGKPEATVDIVNHILKRVNA